MTDTPNERTLKLALETFTELASTLKRERDEAREQIEVCRGIIERTLIARNSALSDLTELERERDEAREALMKIEEVFIDSDDTYEDLIKVGNIARAALGSKT